MAKRGNSGLASMSLATSSSVKHAVIVAVGTELLTPHKIDTNSLFLTEKLNNIGVEVIQKLVTTDEPEALARALEYARTISELVLVTGGLGPTDDDRTRDVIADILRLPLVEDAGLLRLIEERFASRGLAMPTANRRQAEVPRGAVVIDNPRGTAPGLVLVDDESKTRIVLLPGPPRELKPMFESVIARRLIGDVGGASVYRRVVRTTGQTESYVDELAQPLYREWSNRVPSISTTILASLGQIDLHLTLVGADRGVANAVLDVAVDQLKVKLGSLVYSVDGDTLPEVVGALLVEKRLNVGVAESCTGGLIASRLTDVPGSSSYFQGGVTTYSNGTKVSVLGIEGELLRQHGAVSEPVAKAMAMNARLLLNSDYALGVTGIAGPGGGTQDKPVGTVYLGLAGPDGLLKVRQLSLPGERERVKFQAAQSALDLLRRALIKAG